MASLMRRRRALILFMLMTVFVIVLDVVTIRFMDRKQSEMRSRISIDRPQPDNLSPE